jgi:putative transposase
MPRALRPRRPGVTIFFTVALAERGGRVLVDHVGLLCMAVAQTRAERSFAIEAWVVPPDHLQCIWRLPKADTDHATRWGAIKARFTRAVKAELGWNPTLRSASKIAKGDAGPWQRRFHDHHTPDEADHAAHWRSCWFNPVKHGLVERPEDWPYSSVHRDIASGGHAPTAWITLAP